MSLSNSMSHWKSRGKSESQCRFNNLKETAMKNIKQKLLITLFIIGACGGASWATNTPADATITVTPIANVSLSLNTTFYDFGAFAVNTSTNSGTKLTLSNNGQVDVTVDKRITNQSNPVGWTAGTSAGLDTYALYVATSTTRPLLTDYSTGNHQFGILSNVTALKGLGGSTPVITNPAGALPSVDLWFKLDMPTTVSSQVARAITVRFTGTAQ
jgi:hypothetical protein